MTTKFRTIRSLTNRHKRRQRMAQTGVTMKRNASLAIPDDYLTLAVKENPTAWGAAIATPDGLITSSGDATMDIAVMKDTFKDFDNRDFYIYLCNSESAINMDDVSPFWLLDKDDSPLLVAFIEGSFPGFAKTGSSHPSEYHFLQDHLQPKITDLWELCDGDLLKLMAFIEKPAFKKELLVHANPRGCVTFVAANGKALTFATGEGSCEYKWGWVSQNYGYALDAPKPEKKPEETAKKSLFPNKSTTREKHIPSAPEGTPVAPSAGAGAVAVQNFTVRKEGPRSTDSRADRKKFYQRRIGYCPVGWEKHIAIEVWVDPVTNQTVFVSEIKKLGIDAVGVPKLNNPPRAESGKDVEPNNISGGERQTGPAVTDAVLPILSPKAREYAHDLLRKEDIKKLIAENGSPISDPKDTKGNEIKIVGFGEQLGMKDGLADFGRLPPSQFKKIAAENPELMWNLCWHFKNAYFAAKIKEGEKLSAEEVHEAAHEELKPVKKSLFPQKKVA